MPRAFVIRPFGRKTDSAGKQIDFERVHGELIGPALEATGLGGSTTGEIVEPGNIREDMFSLIFEADVVVCDITVHNANVFYELGIRHALRKKRTVLIKGGPTRDSPPFDLLTDRYLPYAVDDPAAAKDSLAQTITAALASERETDSPIFKMLPDLPEADPSSLTVVPLDFSEEVRRARAAKAKGWLRLVAEEVKRLRFEREGLKLVAAAQWDLKDYEGSRETWQAIRDTHPNDVTANLALANIYERLYRENKQPALLEASDHAIERVLKGESTTRKQLAEALALKGRNQKTRWRLEYEGRETTEERRKAAMSRLLLRSYEAYRDAYFEDLNHFYSGLNALQMGTVLVDLAAEPRWYDAFESDPQADAYRGTLERDIASLRPMVALAVAAALRRMDENDPERVWAQISNADVLFLSDPQREARVVAAYKDAVPRDKPFAWDAARGQLELFEALGIRAEMARLVIEELDARLAAQEPTEQRKPVHLLVFAGHRVDAPGRAQPRFPPEQEERAQSLIREAVTGLLDDQHVVIGLASAAPGTDILAHEVCKELGLTSTVCLPMPPDAFARFAFENLDRWRTRFLDLQKDHEVLVLADSEGLPKWLHGSAKDPWERGNQWVMKMALTAGAERITLVVLWDGKQEGDAPGGTAHMLRLAQDAGKVHIKRIDSTQLVMKH
jgi:hypothetical protein